MSGTSLAKELRSAIARRNSGISSRSPNGLLFLRRLGFWYPVAFPMAYVLLAFATTPVAASSIVRPVWVAVFGGVVLQILVWALVRDRQRTPLVTSGVVLIALAAWVPLAVITAAVLWWAIVQRLRARRNRTLMRPDVATLNRLARTFSLFLLAVSAIAPTTLLAPTVWNSISTSSATTADRARADVVIIMLDGYPRADALQSMTGYDNRPFIDELEERGFHVAPRARSNYTATWPTLASMVHGAYLHDIETLPQPYPVDAAQQYRALMGAIARGPMTDRIRAAGYDSVTIPPPLEGAEFSAAERVLRPSAMSGFEIGLLQSTAVGSALFSVWPEAALDQHRAWTTESLALLVEEMRASRDRPRFVLAHLISPHPPIAWGAAGEPIAANDCFPRCPLIGPMSDSDWSMLPGQIEHLNRLILQTVDAIRLNDRNSTVVLMSDHGMHRPGTNPANAFKTLFAIAGHDGTVPEAIQPTQVLSLLVGGEDAVIPYEGWLSDSGYPLNMTPYAGPAP